LWQWNFKGRAILNALICPGHPKQIMKACSPECLKNETSKISYGLLDNVTFFHSVFHPYLTLNLQVLWKKQPIHRHPENTLSPPSSQNRGH
jgi:hypothetical protein